MPNRNPAPIIPSGPPGSLPGGLAPSLPGVPGSVAPTQPIDISVGRMQPRPLDEIKQILGLFGIGTDKKGERPEVDTSLVGGPTPTISTGPVIGSDLIQQQINAARAGIAQSTATGQQRLAEQMGARGLDASPALLAMQAQLGSRGLGQEVGAERDLRLGAAERNAGHVLQAQTALANAVENAFGNRQREQIQRQQIQMSPFQGLLGNIMQSVLSGGLG